MIFRYFILLALFSSPAFTEPSPEPSPDPYPEPAPAPVPEPSPDPDPQGGAVNNLLTGVGGLVSNLLEDLLGGGGRGCVDTIDISLNFNYCNQPLFVTFLTKTDAHCLIDNICFTYFPLPDDPFTYNVYSATVLSYLHLMGKAGSPDCIYYPGVPGGCKLIPLAWRACEAAVRNFGPDCTLTYLS